MGDGVRDGVTSRGTDLARQGTAIFELSQLALKQFLSGGDRGGQGDPVAVRMDGDHTCAIGLGPSRLLRRIYM